MFTIIKNEIEKSLNTSQAETILNIVYGDNEDYVKKWIEIYFDNIIEKKDKNEIFFVEIKNGIYYLVRKYQVIVKGYIFNTPKQITEQILSVRYIKFIEENHLLKTLSNHIKLKELHGLYPEITSNINHKVLNQVDKDSLYEIYCAFEGAIRTKQTWNTSELIILQDKITRDFKRDLYSTVLKKFKKIANKQNKLKNQSSSICPLSTVSYSCKTVMMDESNKIIDCRLIDLSKRNSNGCSLEYTIINNENK